MAGIRTLILSSPDDCAAPSMHSLMTRVLARRQLGAAAQLFALNDYDVITDLHSAFEHIRNIFDSPDYLENRVDQSVVEIVIARITAAVRETGSIETYSADLVDLLDRCLEHNMNVSTDNEECVDSPHCKIANDLLSSLFLHYSKKSVMTLTLPVAIKVLGCSNQDLVRNTSSYISLAALHNGKALSYYAVQLITFIIHGNYSLLRVLPQIYPDHREPFHAHLSPLMAVLNDETADCSEKLSLLQLASLIANHKPDLLPSYLHNFDSFLTSPTTCTAVLNIYMSLVSQDKSQFLAPFMTSLKEVATKPSLRSNLGTAVKIIGNIGRVSLPLAREAVGQLMRSSQTVDTQLLSSILGQVEGIAAVFPASIRPHVEEIKELSTGGTSRIIERIIALAGVSSCPSNSAEITVIRVPNDKNSCDSLLDSQQKMGQTNIITSGSRTLVSVSDAVADCSTQELDRNTHTLAMQYQNRSSGSLSRNQSRSRASVAGQRSTSNMSGSRDLSLSSIPHSLAGSSRVPPDYVTRPPPQYQPPTTQTLPAGFAPNRNIQIGRDGRVRPVAGGRRQAQWPPGSYETTFPANSGPVTTTKMHALQEEETHECDYADRSDVVQQFVDHRRNKIRRYITEVTARFPVPIQCTVEGSKGSKHRMIVHFACQARSSYCVFNEEYLFNFKTKLPSSWLHLMFLQMQATSIDSTGRVVSQSSPSFLTLANCWQCLPSSITKGKQFVTLVTSAFPSNKDQDRMLRELLDSSFFDCISLEGISNKWMCFSCSHPEKAKTFVEECGSRVLEGRLKEKKGRWRFIRRWHTKYFTLSSAALSSSAEQKPSSGVPGIDLRNIRSVRSLGRGKKNRKSLRSAFEIFTADNSSLVLKANDTKQAEEWMHCLQIAIAQAKKES